MDTAIEVRYAGVAVGRATQVRDWTDAGAFIGFAEPLPTGTRVELRGDGVRQIARVEAVIESADPAAAGMRVRFVTESAPAPAPAPQPAPVQAVVSEPAAPVVSEAHPADLGESGPNPAGESGPNPAGESGPNAAGGGGKRRRRRR